MISTSGKAVGNMRIVAEQVASARLNSQRLELLLGITGAGGNVRLECRGELRQVGRIERKRGGAAILVEVRAPLRAGDRNDVLPLREEPRQRDLRGSRFMRRSDAFDRLEERAVALDVR